MEKALPAIPAKRYFTIGEVSELCGVKPYVLRYWEQEFSQLKPMKRRGNRRYYQHHEVLLVRRIRALLYDQGFTINGARNRLSDALTLGRAMEAGVDGAESEDHGGVLDGAADAAVTVPTGADHDGAVGNDVRVAQEPANGATRSIEAARGVVGQPLEPQHLRAELLSIRDLLTA